jgi:phosphoglucomutase
LLTAAAYACCSVFSSHIYMYVNKAKAERRKSKKKTRDGLWMDGSHSNSQRIKIKFVKGRMVCRPSRGGTG